MADTKLTALSALTSLSADDLLCAVDDPGGTPASKKITALDAFGLLFGPGMISVTGATTATIGRMHYCTGTSADYTVTLPAASGNAGKMIGFQMGPIAALSKLVTLDGNSTEKIDDALTRVMWALESAILLCDGSNWFKIAGKSIPMSQTIARAVADQSLTGGGNTAVVFDTVTQANAPAAMFNSGTGFATVLRANAYIYSAFLVGSTVSTSVYPAIYINGAPDSPYQQYAAAGGAVAMLLAFTRRFAVSDAISAAINPSSAMTLYGPTPWTSNLTLTEVVSW